MTNIEIYQAENAEIEFKGDLEHETVWASQKQLAELFGTKVPAINKHIKNILKEEVDNLYMIISIGYRVNSKLAIHFRRWATSILKKYLLDGYALNEKKLTKTKDIPQSLKATIEFLSTKEIGHQKENIDVFEGCQSDCILTYEETKEVLATLKTNLMAKKERGLLIKLIKHLIFESEV